MKTWTIFFFALIILGFTDDINQPIITINSSSISNAFHLTMSIRSGQQFEIYCPKIVKESPHKTSITTYSTSTTFLPELETKNLLVNNIHEGRHWLSYYEQQENSEFESHFYIISLNNSPEPNYFLLPALGYNLGWVPVNSLYRCENILISLVKEGKHIHIQAFSFQPNWSIHQNVDTGIRNYDHETYYSTGSDFDSEGKITIQLDNRQYCEITEKQIPAQITFNWNLQSDYTVRQVLGFIKQSLPIKKIKTQPHRSEQL